MRSRRRRIAYVLGLTAIAVDVVDAFTRGFRLFTVLVAAFFVLSIVLQLVKATRDRRFLDESRRAPEG